MLAGSLTDHIWTNNMTWMTVIAFFQYTDKIFLCKLNVIIQHNNVSISKMFFCILIALVVCIGKSTVFFYLQNLDLGIFLIFQGKFFSVFFRFLNVIVHNHNSNSFLLFHCQNWLYAGVCHFDIFIV